MLCYYFFVLDPGWEICGYASYKIAFQLLTNSFFNLYFDWTSSVAFWIIGIFSVKKMRSIHSNKYEKMNTKTDYFQQIIQWVVQIDI